MPIVTIRMVSTSSEQSDSRLRERMLVGDLAALSEVFEYNHARFWHLVYFRMDVRLRSRIDPDDVLQDAFVAAESRLNHFVESENVSSAVWLRSIVLQTLVDLHRRHLETQARDASLDVSLHRSQGGQHTSVCLAEFLSGGMTSPSNAVIRAENEQRMQAALTGMSDSDQEIIALRHLELLSNAEASEVLGIQPKNASIRYVRAMKRLKEAVGEHSRRFPQDAESLSAKLSSDGDNDSR
jgi:RNA polymerase sigma-70 factor, ECF subfamily